MKDPELEAYVEAVEGHLRARRGVDHILTPRDFALARSWQRGGLPLATVLVGMDRAFASGDALTSLAHCRRFVEELAASGPVPQRRAGPPAESVPVSQVTELLGTLYERLLALPPLPRASFEPPLRKVQEVRDLLAVASRPNWSYLREKLLEIDDDVSAAAVEALGEADAVALRQEANRAVERYRGRIREDALEDAQARFLVQRARERLDLPRVSLL
ncbi:MAG TPA: hypothetical protein VJU18_06795 [Vicinamibacteria bacterium]|nr:hypothetical protein [Vicinamibacteria bacterium]